MHEHKTRLTNLPALDVRPLVTLDVQRDGSESREQNNGLDTSLLALVVLGFGRPIEEGNHVLGHLGCRGGGAVVKLDETVKEDTGHGDGVTREVRIVVHALTDFETSRGVGVTSEEGEDVVLHSKKGSARLVASKTSYINTKARTGPPWRALTIKLKSGGRAPPLLARAASSLG